MLTIPKSLPCDSTKLHPALGPYLGQGSSKADFMAIRIGDVKEALAPLGVARRRPRTEAGGDKALVKIVDVALVEDRAAPPFHLGRLGGEIKEALAGAKAG